MDHYELALDLYSEGKHIKALELIENARDQANQTQMSDMGILEGTIFKHLAEETESSDVRFLYLLASLECYHGFPVFRAEPLFKLAEETNSLWFYKKSLKEARDGLSLMASSPAAAQGLQKEKETLEDIVGSAEVKISRFKNSDVKDAKDEESKKKSVVDCEFLEESGDYLGGLSADVKRSFMKIEAASFRTYVENQYGEEGIKTLEKVLKYARKYESLRMWLCRVCDKKFSSSGEFESHLKEEHDTTNSKSAKVIHYDWQVKFTSGYWKPVEAAAAFDLIKNSLTEVRAFPYVDGWSKDWPVAKDEERSKVLNDIRLMFLLLDDRKLLSVSIRSYIMGFVLRKLQVFATSLEVPEQNFVECSFVETPQSICFLGLSELNHIVTFLKKIKHERTDGCRAVKRAVKRAVSSMLIKEKLHFSSDFSFLLLDKRLLVERKLHETGDNGNIKFLNPDAHCRNVHPQGDAFLSWLADESSEHDDAFQFPRPIKEHCLDLWVAVLKGVQFMEKTLEKKREKKLLLEEYEAAIIVSKMLLIEEARTELLENLMSLSVFDYRFYIYPLLKGYLKAAVRLHQQENQ